MRQNREWQEPPRKQEGINHATNLMTGKLASMHDAMSAVFLVTPIKALKFKESLRTEHSVNGFRRP
jgi:hypothetical protein